MRALVVAAVLASVLFLGTSAVFAQYTNQPVTPDNSQPGVGMMRLISER